METATAEKYNVVNGTSYPASMPKGAVDALERCRASGTRVLIRYCYDGKPDSLDEHEVIGTVGRSMGPVKAPLLIHNARSHGGGTIGANVARISQTATGRVLWQSPAYRQPELKIRPCDIVGTDGKTHYGVEVTADGETHARFRDLEAARRWARRLQLKISEDC